MSTLDKYQATRPANHLHNKLNIGAKTVHLAHEAVHFGLNPWPLLRFILVRRDVDKKPKMSAGYKKNFTTKHCQTRTHFPKLSASTLFSLLISR
jgi:hypothetical protein